jgi:hypothetical protein
LEQEYGQRLRAPDGYADYVERMAVAEAEAIKEEDGGDEPPTPPAAPSVLVRIPAEPHWTVLLAGSAGRIAYAKAESRAARRRRRAERARAA